MKSVIMKTFLILVILTAFSFDMKENIYLEDELLEEIKQTSVKFEKAVSVRNFKSAQEQLDILFPLIKKEIKESKKELHNLEKSQDVSAAQEMQLSIERKLEIEASLMQISSGSSASLRVQSDNAVLLVKEYIKMLDATKMLITSNN